jgi:hypothetical protein
MSRTTFYSVLAVSICLQLAFVGWGLRPRRPSVDYLDPDLNYTGAIVEGLAYDRNLQRYAERFGNLVAGLLYTTPVIIAFYEITRLVGRRRQHLKRFVSAVRAELNGGLPPSTAAVEPPPHEDDANRLRGEAAAIRRGTSLAIALADSVPAAALRGRDEDSPHAVVRAAACETLGRTLERRAHGDDRGIAAHLAAADFEQLRELGGRVERLRTDAGHPDLAAAAAALLDERAAVCAESTGKLQAALDAFAGTEKVYRDAVRDAATRLRGEIALLDRDAPGSGAPSLSGRIDDYCGPSAAAGGVSPAVLDVDGTRIADRLARVASALAAFAATNDVAAAECVRLAEGAIQRVCAGGLMRRPTAAGETAIAEPPAGVPAVPSAVLLEYGRGPELAALAVCPDLAVLLDAGDGFRDDVGDEGSSAAGGESGSQRIATAVARFSDAVRAVDAAIARGLSAPADAAARLAAARAILEALESGLDARRVRAGAATLADDIERAKDAVKTAAQLAMVGEIDLAERLAVRAARAALGGVDMREADGQIAAARSWLATAEEMFQRVREDAGRIQMWRQGALFAESGRTYADSLRASLADFFTHRSSRRIGPGGGTSRVLHDLARECEPWCRIVAYEPPPCGWATMTAAVLAARPESVEPGAAFVDALCAMAAADRGVDGAEAGAIRDAVARTALPLDEARVAAILAGWRRDGAADGRVAAVARAVVNVDAIAERRMLERLHRELRAVARADGGLGEAEICVYHAFLIRIAHRLHGDGDPPR